MTEPGYTGALADAAAAVLFEHGVGALATNGVFGDPRGASSDAGHGYVTAFLDAIERQIDDAAEGDGCHDLRRQPPEPPSPWAAPRALAIGSDERAGDCGSARNAVGWAAAVDAWRAAVGLTRGELGHAATAEDTARPPIWGRHELQTARRAGQYARLQTRRLTLRALGAIHRDRGARGDGGACAWLRQPRFSSRPRPWR